MNTDNRNIEYRTQNTDAPTHPSPLKVEGTRGGKNLDSGFWAIFSAKKISRLRRFVLFAVIILFLLQFLRIKVLIGSLTGSLAVWFVKLIDVFAYFESLAASRDFVLQALTAALPIIGIYLIFGRAFCGWICPMDFLYELIDKIRTKDSLKKKIKVPPKIGYVIMGSLLLVSLALGAPFFTNYISHLTNFFRLITGSVYLALKLPADVTVLSFSIAVIFSLLLLEYIFPRLWCRVLCPVGKTYGIFNKISLIKLKFVEGDCGECNLCEQVCYMNVKITHYIDQPGLRDTNCIYCGKCMEGCETKGNLIRIKLLPSLSFRAKRGISS